MSNNNYIDMPKIKLTNGSLKYKTIPLYGGIKRINKEKAFENLCLLKKKLDAAHIPFQLAYGTLLGAVREKDFITHDEDIDLIILGEYKQQFIDVLPELNDVGFRVARYDRRGLLSIIRNNEYIDFYFFDKRDDDLRSCSGILYPAVFFEHTQNCIFKGVDFLIPLDFEGLLRYAYGDNWHIPVHYHNFEISPIKRKILRLREIVKESLPDRIYFLLVKSAEKKFIDKYKPRIEKYRKELAEQKG